jgi:hypothetical protein
MRYAALGAESVKVQPAHAACDAVVGSTDTAVEAVQKVQGALNHNDSA